MALTYSRKKKRNNAIYTLLTVFIIIAVFGVMVLLFRAEAKEEAFEMLHVQTKQIKDDLTLQINSDKENLVTMANFAAKLYARGEDYSIMFDSFKPIGLYSRIGILTPDSIFITKDEAIDISESFPFEKAVLEADGITGRTYSYSRPDEEVVRVSVPIKVNGETVGIMYGIIKIETINGKYSNMAKSLNAQLFVYDKESGKFIVDTIEKNPGELKELETREYKDGYSYEQLVKNDKGYSSFKSIFTGEDLYLHYSTIEDFDWKIMLARYESQVFASSRKISKNMAIAFLIMLLVLSVYLYLNISNERRRSRIATESSEIRKLLLEVNNQHKNIDEALDRVKQFLDARVAFFIDTDREDYKDSGFEEYAVLLDKEERKYFISELFMYAAKVKSAQSSAITYMSITPNAHLKKTNPGFYDLMVANKLKSVSFAIISEDDNHISLLGVTNSRSVRLAKELLEDTAICFSIAIYNNKYLKNTQIIATTDSLTGVLNRVVYKEDILALNKEQPKDFACIYIDVNELHTINNKYGHAAGDEMLIYIANSLKEVFFGHGIYRMGGDEFLVFAKGVSQEDIRQNIETFIKQLVPAGYNVAIGTSYRSRDIDCEEMVREAEIRMYEAKSRYYQSQSNVSIYEENDRNYIQKKTGIDEIDTMISVLKEHYNGIYRVSLETDTAHRILMPAYLGYNEDEENFSQLVGKYVDELVAPDFRRAVRSFLNYEAIRKQVADGNSPSITYKKIDGDSVILSIYKMEGGKENETLWVFAKD